MADTDETGDEASPLDSLMMPPETLAERIKADGRLFRAGAESEREAIEDAWEDPFPCRNALFPDRRRVSVAEAITSATAYVLAPRTRAQYDAELAATRPTNTKDNSHE